MGACNTQNFWKVASGSAAIGYITVEHRFVINAAAIRNIQRAVDLARNNECFGTGNGVRIKKSCRSGKKALHSTAVAKPTTTIE
jgi:hypothetical protein